MADKLKITYSVIREFKKGKCSKASDYEMSFDEFGKFIDDLQSIGYIEGVSILYANDEVAEISLDDAEVTLEGEKFLKENSKLAKGYEAAKEIREWIKTAVSIIRP